MTSSAAYQPDRYHTVTPYLTVQGAARLIEFLTQVFDARETERILRPDGAIAHADVRIGDAVVMLGEASDGLPPMPGALYVYVPDTDATYRRALQAGAASLMEPVDTFYGDRNAGVTDPFGNRWWLATRVEDVPAEDLQRRADAVV
jgi:PhnB protein